MEIDENEYLRDEAIVEAERIARMNAEWQEAEHYAEKLPAKIIVEIKIPKEDENTTITSEVSGDPQ